MGQPESDLYIYDGSPLAWAYRLFPIRPLELRKNARHSGCGAVPVAGSNIDSTPRKLNDPFDVCPSALSLLTGES